MDEQSPAPSKSQRGLLVIFGLFLLVGAGGAAFLYYQSDWRVPAQVKKLQNPVPDDNDAIGAGMMIYMDHCQGCHGENGDGKGPKAEQLSVAPANFTDARAMAAVTDCALPAAKVAAPIVPPRKARRCIMATISPLVPGFWRNLARYRS